MSVTVAISVTGLTFRALFVIGLAIVALLLTGWRKPARVEARSLRGVRRVVSSRPGRGPSGVAVDQLDVPEYRRPNPLRRVLAAVASGGIGVLMGVLTAIVIAFTLAFAVTWLTGLLRQ